MEMSLSPQELRRQLLRFPGFAASTETPVPGVWHIGKACLHVRPLSPHRIGTLHLPRLAIRIDLSALTPEQRQAFLTRFKRLTFRGGG